MKTEDQSRCPYPSCTNATEKPFTDGWVHMGGSFEGEEPSLWPEGWYCPQHAPTVEVAIDAEIEQDFERKEGK
jgi:hypothetical protein